MKNRSIIPLLLVLLFSYIIAQLFWWAYLITQLTKVVYEGSPKLDTRVTMIWGEGLVFSFLLFLGFIITYKAYRKEMALARQQKNFLLSITHELKTPVASLRLFIETLQSRNLSEEQKKIFIQNALKDTDRLNGLIENILLSARLEKGDSILNKKVINISELLKRNIEYLKNSIGKNHNTILNISPEVYIKIDEAAFISIINNLYDNAVKYSEMNSKINISLSSDESKVKLSFADEGEGISKENKKKVFNKFYRVQNEETRTTKGTGLGLFIVASYVEQHQGTIQVLDNHPKGSIFQIEIPIK